MYKLRQPSNLTCILSRVVTRIGLKRVGLTNSLLGLPEVWTIQRALVNAISSANDRS